LQVAFLTTDDGAMVGDTDLPFSVHFEALVKEAAETLEKESLLGLHYSNDEGERRFFHHQAVFAAVQALGEEELTLFNDAFKANEKPAE